MSISSAVSFARGCQRAFNSFYTINANAQKRIAKDNKKEQHSIFSAPKIRGGIAGFTGKVFEAGTSIAFSNYSTQILASTAGVPSLAASVITFIAYPYVIAPFCEKIKNISRATTEHFIAIAQDYQEHCKNRKDYENLNPNISSNFIQMEINDNKENYILVDSIR